MDGNIDAAMDRLWLLSGMDGVGGKAMMPVGEVLAFAELLVLNFFFSLFVEHQTISYMC